MSGSASGVDGLGSRHAWKKLDLSATLLTLGDLSADPLYKLLALPGFYSTPEMPDNRHPKTGTFGEEVATAYAGGKTFDYEGVIQGSTRDKCLIGKTNLMAAFGPDVANASAIVERRMIITPSSTLTHSDDTPSGNPHTYVGVCRRVTIDDKPPRRITEEGAYPIRWALPFVIEIRITSGLFWEWSGSAESNAKYA